MSDIKTKKMWLPDINKVKAEGIREMVSKVKKDYYNPVTETTTDLIEMDEALDYADKLVKSDEN